MSESWRTEERWLKSVDESVCKSIEQQGINAVLSITFFPLSFDGQKEEEEEEEEEEALCCR